ncbi:MAG: glycosyltransferase family 1 protein [Ignavibacteriales bacterium]|nr:MAG: glycosyltransferase family 1 protein [Ignavibacteriales bacterium]
MKIVHVISSFSPGGAEVLVKDIAILSARKYEVEVWAVGATGDENFEKKYINELISNNVGYVNVGKVVHQKRLWVVFQLRKLIKQRNPDVINTHSELATFYCAPASLGLKVKLVQTIHNTVIAFPRLQRYFAKPLIKKFVAISDRCKDLIKDVIKVKESKIALIFNGINIAKFRNTERVIRPDVKNILCVGRLDIQKDHATLLRSFAVLKSKLLESGFKIPKLNLIGIGVLQKELEILSLELGLSDDVIFWKARNDIPEKLIENDIWVMSSRWEGLSIALLEAFSSGIPVIATNVGSNAEVIDDNVNGSLVEKENPEQLAEALFRLIKDVKLRETFSANAQLKAKTYTIESCVTNYLVMYNSFFEPKPSGIAYKSMDYSYSNEQ